MKVYELIQRLCEAPADAECPSRAVAFVGRRQVWKIERGDEMAVILVIPEEWKDAQDIESFRNWRSWMPYMEPKSYAYVNGEARHYYKHVSGRYFYRKVTESEMHRNK